MQSSNQIDDANAAMLLKQKFKSKSQLYSYLTQRLQVFLPEIDSCRMQFLLDIFGGNKDVVLNENVPHFSVPSQPEVSVKVVFSSLVNDGELMRYFDTDRYQKTGKLPPKHFFWGIMFTVRKDLTTSLLSEVIDKRLQSNSLQNQEQPINFSRVWAEKLLEYPAMHTGGKTRQTNLFSMMARARQPAQRRPVEIPETLQKYQQSVMPVSDHHHVTIRKRQPNVIANKDDDEEWKQSME